MTRAPKESLRMPSSIHPHMQHCYSVIASVVHQHRLEICTQLTMAHRALSARWATPSPPPATIFTALATLSTHRMQNMTLPIVSALCEGIPACARDHINFSGLAYRLQ